MADTAHQAGNTFYKNGDLEGAEKSYALALKLDPSEPKYASNLSAVFYEQGRYILCIDAIMNSWRALRAKNAVDGQPASPPITDAMAIKLSLRFLKAKLHSIARGLISFHDKRKNKGKTAESNAGIEQDIQTFCQAITGEAPSKYPEHQQVWGAWVKAKKDCEGHTPEECKMVTASAEKRLRGLPVFRPTLYDVMEYYRFGHDPTRSLFYGLDNRRVAEFNINEKTVLKEKWQNFAFLFGGSGDGRHVFGTITHFTDIWKKLDKLDLKRSKMPKLHLTLVDIHPAALARVMLVFALIRKSMSPPNAIARLEMEATAFYAWGTISMPEYCANVVTVVSQEIVDELKGNAPQKLSKLWAIDEQSKSRLVTIFEYWAKPLRKSMKKFFDLNGPNNLLNDLTTPRGRSIARNHHFQAMLADLRKRGLVDIKKDPDFPLYNNCDAEEALFEEVRILLPPKRLLNRHPALEKYVRSGGTTGKAAMKEEVIKNWKPNPTLFDNKTTENACFAAGGYPIVSSSNPFQTMGDCLSFVLAFRDGHEISLDQTSFVLMQQFFDSVRQSLAMMDPEEDVTLEFVCCELYSGLPKLIAGDFGQRPASFPTKYLRMWLSNTPDYQGSVMSNLVYLMPYLEDTKYAMMLWNCLLNPASFTNLKDICFNYTYLTASDIRRFFNCLVRDERKGSLEEFNMSILPRTKTYSSIVSKKELHHYLSMILMRAICCPKSGQKPFRVDEPANVANFMRLLVTLCQNVGCPGHWLGDFVQNIINDTLLTTATPFTGVLPITQLPPTTNTPRKVNLDPWQLEMETILVSSKGALPFAVTFPDRYAPSHDSIKTYTATNVVVTANLPYDVNVSPVTKTTSLMFYKAGPNHTTSFLRSLPSRIPDLIESREGVFSGLEVQIVSVLETVDLERNRVSWRMSEGWYEKMKKEGWYMIVWVTNQWRAVSAPVSASSWKDATANSISDRPAHPDDIVALELD